MVSGPFIRQEGEMLKENRKIRLIIRIDQIKYSVVADTDPYSRNL
jgi:hypothetical protein